MDYYQTLGVNENASQDEIRAAYKKLAMKNHPDRGGDTKRFQEISQAYDTLGDENKRREYDAQKNGFHHFSNGMGGHPFQDISEMFGFKFGPGFQGFDRNIRKNKDLSIRISVTLKQSYTGTQIEAKYATPNGRNQTIIIDIPAGVAHGQTVRYGGLGDDTIPSLPRGNLNVIVLVDADPNFERINDDLHGRLDLTLIEAMTGCTKEFKNLDGTVLPITIRPGVTNGTEFCATGKGFRSQTGRVGNLYIKLNVSIPALKNKQLIKEMEDLYAKISKAS